MTERARVLCCRRADLRIALFTREKGKFGPLARLKRFPFRSYQCPLGTLSREARSALTHPLLRLLRCVVFLICLFKGKFLVFLQRGV